MQWNQNQLEIIARIKNIEDVPKTDRKYKCLSCAIAFTADDIRTDRESCPRCGTTDIQQMCPLDHLNCGKNMKLACYHKNIFDYAEMCPICGEPMCPGCGSHDVEVMSRITGYLQDFSGWNRGKKQEFHDRVRYTL